MQKKKKYNRDRIVSWHLRFVLYCLAPSGTPYALFRQQFGPFAFIYLEIQNANVFGNCYFLFSIAIGTFGRIGELAQVKSFRSHWTRFYYLHNKWQPMRAHVLTAFTSDLFDLLNARMSVVNRGNELCQIIIMRFRSIEFSQFVIGTLAISWKGTIECEFIIYI